MAKSKFTVIPGEPEREGQTEIQYEDRSRHNPRKIRCPMKIW